MERRVFAWQVLCETNSERMSFPIAIAEEPVSDEQIKRYIEKVVRLGDIAYEADDIYHLTFIAVSEVGDDRIIEPLNPFVFWPNKPCAIGHGNTDKFRVTKGGEK